MEGQEDRHAPLELGTVGPESPAAEAHSATSPWRRWVGLGAALSVGAVVGVVGNNARNDAAEYAQVELVSGPLEPQFSNQPRWEPDSLLVNLINTGPREVDILGVEVDGFTVPADGQPPDPVPAEPGRWVRVQIQVDADCEARPSGTIRVHVRTESGEQTTDIAPPVRGSGLGYAWQAGCEPAGTVLFIGETRTVSSDATSVEFMLPITNSGLELVQIVSFESATPGFAAQSVVLPVDVSAGGFASVQVTWTVDDCEAVERMTDANVAFNTVEGEREQRGSQPLGNRALIELVRLAVRVCET